MKKIQDLTNAIRRCSECELDYGTLKTLKMIDDEAAKLEAQKPDAVLSSPTELPCVELAEIKGKYYELILAVATKNPDETRHETALRYITQAENTADNCAGKENT